MNRLERGVCLWCEAPIIMLNHVLCGKCTNLYHRRAKEITDNINRAKARGERHKAYGRIRISKGSMTPKPLPKNDLGGKENDLSIVRYSK